MNSDDLERSSKAAFPATRWTQVMNAASAGTSGAEESFGGLYCDYWGPLYAYLRRRGLAPEEAEDVTQNFFVRLIEKQSLKNLEREGGRFRSFLLGSLRHFLANEWDYQQAKKRGGGLKPLSLEVSDEEGRYLALEVSSQLTPESLFERQWVLTLIDHVINRLRDPQPSKEQRALFEDLRAHLQSDRVGLPYAEIARKHGTTEGAIKVNVHRLRQRFGSLLREEIARTVSSENEIEDELRHLIRVISD
jgi:RNA polymerase sigma factor (sigma-70 family)